ncbi:MAG TPA: alkane 1-monooxygenase [Solimonas sp.]
MTTQTLATGTPAAWKDGKRGLWMMGVLWPALPLISAALALSTGMGLFWWLTPVVIYGVLPLLDRLVGEDRVNAPESAVAALENDRYYRMATFLFIPVQYICLIGGAWLAVSGGLPALDILGLAVSVGLVSGAGINTAHELGHKRENLERWLARITLAPAMYGHFYVEHNRGHHVRVATPEDPASSRLGESFYAFWPRSVWGSLTSAWHLEKVRLERQGKSVWNWRNDNLQSWAMTLVLFGALALWLGPIVLPFLIFQGFIGFSLLEVVNYLEHYGLVRQKEASGRYERCKPEHSWNSNHTVTNLMLYHLQRHSDHHANPMRRYQALRHFEQAPQLPSGYAGMIVVAMIPPLWRSLMDKRVLAHYQGDVTRANIHPPVREKILAKYGATQPQTVEA